MKIAIIVFILTASYLTTAIFAQALQLPEGEGKEKVRSTCALCHGLEIVTSQRLSRNGWNDIVERMIKWGAPVQPEDKKVIINYLSVNFGEEKKLR